MQESAGTNADTADFSSSLAAFAASGQDKEAVQIVFDWLLADLKPQNLIEKLWVRDIATLTVRCSELRMVQVAVHKLLMEQALAADAPKGLPASLPGQTGLVVDGRSTGKAAASTGAKAEGITEVLARASEGLQERLVGLTYTQHLALFDGMTKLEAIVRAERDRAISQFDRRRSEAARAIRDAMRDAMMDAD